ncbi:MAG: tRNA dihydrouridine synthase DusB [Candidatus Latescibacteria bacterium]|nr:tRNA dihydrouridine synthase DusB [Candidatus Latescibacterota bacterium]
MQIGPYQLAPFRPDMPILTLAPMAGVGNWVFRLLCARLGARLVGVEFINCRIIGQHSRKSELLLDFSDAPIYRQTGQSLLAAQIYGNDIGLIAAGAQELERRGSHIVDINFGCSVPRILQRGCGAAYLRDLDRLYKAVRATVDAVTVPVTVKTRLGWDAGSINLLEVVRRAQDAGAQAIGIHARTVEQKYKGEADWDWIARAVEVAQVPILGNGDVRSYEDAQAMQRQTGCHGVMVGRAAMANPWIFSGHNGAPLPDRIELAIEQLRFMARYKGPRVGVLESRKHLALYFKGIPRTSDLRRQLLTTESLDELVGLLESWRQRVDLPDEENLSLSHEEAGALAWGGND